MSKERTLQSKAILIGPYLVSTGRRYVPHSRSYTRCFAPCFWRSPRSCDLTPLDYYSWGAVKDRCYGDNPETIDGLKDNIREAFGKIQLHTVDNVLKNWSERVGYCMTSRGSQTEKIVLSNNKKRNLKKAFSKKKVFGGPCITIFLKYRNNNQFWLNFLFKFVAF